MLLCLTYMDSLNIQNQKCYPKGQNNEKYQITLKYHLTIKIKAKNLESHLLKYIGIKYVCRLE